MSGLSVCEFSNTNFNEKSEIAKLYISAANANAISVNAVRAMAFWVFAANRYENNCTMQSSNANSSADSAIIGNIVKT